MAKGTTLAALEVKFAGGGAVILSVGKLVSFYPGQSLEIVHGHLVTHVHLNQICNVFHGSTLILLEAGKVTTSRE